MSLPRSMAAAWHRCVCSASEIMWSYIQICRGFWRPRGVLRQSLRSMAAAWHKCACRLSEIMWQYMQVYVDMQGILAPQKESTSLPWSMDAAWHNCVCKVSEIMWQYIQIRRGFQRPKRNPRNPLGAWRLRGTTTCVGCQKSYVRIYRCVADSGALEGIHVTPSEYGGCVAQLRVQGVRNQWSYIQMCSGFWRPGWNLRHALGARWLCGVGVAVCCGVHVNRDFAPKIQNSPLHIYIYDHMISIALHTYL